MTERERLIELIGEIKANEYGGLAKVGNEAIADYLLENGVIVPGVKVGDTVYIFERGSYIIPLCGQGKPHWEIKIEKCSFKYWMLDNHKFGVNMFFTREEAENALEEREKK